MDLYPPSPPPLFLGLLVEASEGVLLPATPRQSEGGVAEEAGKYNANRMEQDQRIRDEERAMEMQEEREKETREQGA